MKLTKLEKKLARLYVQAMNHMECIRDDKSVSPDCEFYSKSKKWATDTAAFLQEVGNRYSSISTKGLRSH